jgi:hypothetical protein
VYAHFVARVLLSLRKAEQKADDLLIAMQPS